MQFYSCLILIAKHPLQIKLTCFRFFILRIARKMIFFKLKPRLLPF